MPETALKAREGEGGEGLQLVLADLKAPGTWGEWRSGLVSGYSSKLLLTHPPQFAHWELSQPVASEGEGKDPGVLEGGRQVGHGHVGTLNGPQVITCPTWLHGCWRPAMRPLSQVQESPAKSGDKRMRRGGGEASSHFYPHSQERRMCTQISLAIHVRSHSTLIHCISTESRVVN